MVWRPSGIIPSKSSAASACDLPVARISMSSWNGVDVGPGCRVMTRIRRSATSAAADFISPTWPCLAAT